MAMTYREAQKKFQAAQDLFLDPTISLEKVKSISTLLHNIHPDIDAALTRFEKDFEVVEKAYEGRVVELGIENLPETTEEERRRKQALLLFLGTWNKLKAEVARVDAELRTGSSSKDVGEKVSSWGRVFGVAKGPLGIITIVAVGVVLTMHATSIKLTIQNEGCGVMVLSGSVPISLPGFSLPKDSIPSGGSGVATLPPLTVSVDGTSGDRLTLKALSFSMSFELPSSIKDVTVNGTSLLNKKQDIHLSEQKTHTLTLTCN